MGPREDSAFGRGRSLNGSQISRDGEVPGISPLLVGDIAVPGRITQRTTDSYHPIPKDT